MEVSQQDRNLAMVVHGLVALTGLSSVVPVFGGLGLLAAIATVVLYFVWKTRGDFVARHAKQAAGFQVVLFVIGLILGILGGGLMVGSAAMGSVGGAIAMGGLLALIGWVIGLAALAVGVMGLLKAQKGEEYIYPVIGKSVDNLKI